VDLRTNYLGIELKHPVAASASPLSGSVDSIRQMEDAGAAAVVMHSLFEEQLNQEIASIERYTSAGAEAFAEALSYFPEVETYRSSSDRYLETLRVASECTDIPIIGSLNGISAEGWVGYATGMEQAGAAAIELNIYYIPADLTTSGRVVEERYLKVVRAVRNAVSLPLALKLSPFFSAVGYMANDLAIAGVDGLVLFNRFYQPDFDIDKLEVSRELDLSDPSEIRLGLLWLSVLHNRLDISLAASSGVETGAEVVKYLMAGADVVMTTASLLRNGIEHIGTIRQQLVDWMGERGYDSVDRFRGCMSLENVSNPSAYERANYIRLLEEYDTGTA
jgi:dihydroorotate dehydrogenase (fumarate)